MSGTIHPLYRPTLQAAMEWGLGNEEQLHQLGTTAGACTSVSNCLGEGDMFDPALLRDVFVTVVAAEQDLPQPTHEVTASLARLVKLTQTAPTQRMSDQDFESAQRSISGLGQRILESQAVACAAITRLGSLMSSACIAAGESAGSVMENPERKSAFVAICSRFQGSSGCLSKMTPDIFESHPNVPPQAVASMVAMAAYIAVPKIDPAYHAINMWRLAEKPDAEAIWSTSVPTGIAWWLATRITAQPEPQVVNAAKDPEIQRFMNLAMQKPTPQPSQRLALFAKAANLVETD